MKKQILSLLTLCAVMLNMTACSGKENSASTTDSAADNSQISEAVSSPEKLPESTDNSEAAEKQGAYYDDVFEAFAPQDPFTSGAPITYNEAMEIISKPRYNGVDSFYLVEAIDALTLPECENLRGFEEWFSSLNGDYENARGKDYYGEHIIYKAKIVKDLITGEERDEEIFLDCVSSNPVLQNEGDPPYSPGEKFTVVTHKRAEDSDITRSCANYLFTLDIYEENGVPIAYAREGSDISDSSVVEVNRISKSVITSTTQNPAKYNAKLNLSNLVDFLRKDWEERGISHYAEEN